MPGVEAGQGLVQSERIFQPARHQLVQSEEGLLVSSGSQWVSAVMLRNMTSYTRGFA